MLVAFYFSFFVLLVYPSDVCGYDNAISIVWSILSSVCWHLLYDSFRSIIKHIFLFNNNLECWQHFSKSAIFKVILRKMTKYIFIFCVQRFQTPQKINWSKWKILDSEVDRSWRTYETSDNLSVLLCKSETTIWHLIRTPTVKVGLDV